MADHANGKAEHEKMHSKVSEWLRELGWTVHPMKQADTLWIMKAVNLNASITLAHPIKSRERFFLHLKRDLQDTDYQKLSDLPEDERVQFIYELYSKLCMARLDFYLDGSPIPTYYLLQESVFYESASRERLERAILDLTLGDRLVHIIIMKAIGTLLQPFEPGFGVFS